MPVFAGSYSVLDFVIRRGDKGLLYAKGITASVVVCSSLRDSAETLALPFRALGN
jgi:hypothetical protein